MFKVLKKILGEPQGFVSDVDKFLLNFNRQHPTNSPSEKKEIAKHAAIAKLRD
ncbi:MAG: hypothetical protein JKY13_03265 [Gammaproteobacteria bacterium]|nr:hypothetical protein [Gammaproteobacteria bacterium]